MPDEVLSNRDDALFVVRLSQVNGTGNTSLSVGQGGHAQPHLALWETYERLFNAKDSQ